MCGPRPAVARGRHTGRVVIASDGRKRAEGRERDRKTCRAHRCGSGQLSMRPERICSGGPKRRARAASKRRSRVRWGEGGVSWGGGVKCSRRRARWASEAAWIENKVSLRGARGASEELGADGMCDPGSSRAILRWALQGPHPRFLRSQPRFTTIVMATRGKHNACPGDDCIDGWPGPAGWASEELRQMALAGNAWQCMAGNAWQCGWWEGNGTDGELGGSPPREHTGDVKECGEHVRRRHDNVAPGSVPGDKITAAAPTNTGHTLPQATDFGAASTARRAGPATQRPEDLHSPGTNAYLRAEDSTLQRAQEVSV
ncbi:uncharacterized protein C8Q71DRAFT_888461 [Rhodofomes roseus]|uniref:Uncharacterized protein n=1 Tax=Rhodofomes roseus TaxID=34475 RepID=A0ABQ8JZE2_9APHY|nr:uncharacterized protein C8Q71DRAFT_888461 [Rhodofomes roseus]KAH9829436.1 hypothetical protein C8Q71DRAFT_888461 [Rhodofomes roseus]